ncbi:phospholipase A2 inhibitor and Ly6/PLAUR domain-containing protein-like [Sceloporus undulatus]|uniref:phospholipase A2 inhibitor and Ly6/PLAUR domain-containing protein-like n=1 Tax=Sceloporus undulatus TaxID=8520 RepID=UPI001C4D15F2|nr:phospholipase A2 inhibitor and Ly6/PLAUR domain-containing protein-like [Sceloporus undulatus]
MLTDFTTFHRRVSHACENASMMSASYVFCLFLAFLALAGAADVNDKLTCQECSNITECQTCTVQTNGGGCVTSVQENTIGRTEETTYSKRCLSFGILSTFFSISLGEGKYLKSNTTFCSEDKCNYNNYTLLANTTLNGLECPTCFSDTDSSCDAKTVPCTGLETYCVSASGVLVRRVIPPRVSFFAAEGCATETVNAFRLPLEISLPHGVYSIVNLQRAKAPTPTNTNSQASGSQTLKSISSVFMLSGLFWMLLLVTIVS